MKKRIAVFISAISLENQLKNVRGILKAGKREGVLIYIFTCHLNFTARVESQEGTYNIYRLPDLSTFDGAIIMKDSIQYGPIADELERRIRSSGIPCVSIDQEIGGMKSVKLDNRSAQYEVVRHMIIVHDCRRFCFVGGYQGNHDGEERRIGFLEACRDFGIPEQDVEVICGNYSVDSGYMAADELLLSGKMLPHAFLCANDQMAIGVIRRLGEDGIRVPEDVAVTGFDADGVGDAYNPMLTTVYKGQEKAGEQAVLMLLGREKKDHCVLQGRILIGRSCGCDPQNAGRCRALRGQYVSQSIMMHQASDLIRNMSSDFAEAETLDAFYEVLKHYIHVGDMKSCYLCMCDEAAVFHRTDVRKTGRLDLTDVNTSYSSTVSCPIAYREGRFLEGGSFASGRVLSETLEEADDADYYVVTPVNYRNCCFG
ncbi:MAG: substrate-binding domain-containing protein, partial [Lachnospiraceae bacterium]|nr:substrate-binding domain-containing protein [Lachnospiraceae bacterium]